MYIRIGKFARGRLGDGFDSVGVDGDVAGVALEESLALRHCGYWFSLRDMPPSDNETGQTIHIPRAQQFTVDALTGMMERLGAGDLP